MSFFGEFFSVLSADRVRCVVVGGVAVVLHKLGGTRWAVASQIASGAMSLAY
jgi:hypothetical protein